MKLLIFFKTENDFCLVFKCLTKNMSKIVSYLSEKIFFEIYCLCFVKRCFPLFWRFWWKDLEKTPQNGEIPTYVSHLMWNSAFQKFLSPPSSKNLAYQFFCYYNLYHLKGICINFREEILILHKVTRRKHVESCEFSPQPFRKYFQKIF